MRSVLLAAALVAFGGCSAPVPSGAGPAEGDRPVEAVTSFWEDGRWEPDSRAVWTYGRPGGEATAVRNQTWRDSAWADHSEERWTLDAEGRQVEGATRMVADGVWAESGRMRFTYDADGHAIAARRRKVYASGLATNADSIASTFVGDRETERRFFRWYDDAWTEGLRQTSTFDAEDRELTRLHRVPADDTEDGWTDQRRWTFTHGPDGDLRSSLVEQAEDGAWTPWLRQTYTLDARGNKAAVVHDEWADGAWAPWMRIETRFDPAR